VALRLARAGEKQARDALTYEVWGSGLTPAQFLAREAHLRAHPWAQRAMRTWLWTEPSGEVSASCETFELNGDVGGQRGRSWVVASVFVEPSKRGQGHAAAMLSALLERLRGEPAAQAVALFSEVGTELYARLGFFAVPSFDTWFEPDGSARPEVDWLRRPLPMPRSPAPAAQVLHLAVDAGQVEWHLERERFYAETLGQPALEAHGARLGPSSIAWTAYWRTRELHVLWLDADDEVQRAALVRAAQATAAQVGLSSVRVWETTPLAHLPGARRARRDDEIAMFAPLAPATQAWTHIQRALWA
jgi:GNAT superfamily N-acetyltransferase